MKRIRFGCEILIALVCVALVMPAVGQPPPGPSSEPGTKDKPQDRSAQDRSVETPEVTRGFSGVGVESLDEMRSLLLIGPKEQTQALTRLIEEIDRLSAVGEPEVRIVLLQHADAQALASLLTDVYESREQARTGNQESRGKVGFTAMAQPNAIVVVAQNIDIEAVVQFVRDLDAKNSEPGAQFRVFRLEQAPSSFVQKRLTDFFEEHQEGNAELRVQVAVVADKRTNSVIVYAGPSDLDQAALLIEQLDGGENIAVNEIRIFELKTPFSAQNLAYVLQQTIVMRSQIADQDQDGAAAGQAGRQAGQTGQGGAGQTAGTLIQSPRLGAIAGGQTFALGSKVSKLRFMTTKEDGKVIESGILEDITVAADEVTNSLIVTAPPSSMGLIAALIEQLDSLPLLPSPSTELKVFTLQNSGAQAMLDTVLSVFPDTPGQAFLVGGGQAQSSLIAPTFSADLRTNSLIVTAEANTMLAIEALILKLDSNPARERNTVIYRLHSLTATEAATTLEDFLNALVAAQIGGEGGLSVQEQIRAEVSIIPEVISNSLLISSTPRFSGEVLRIIEEIDRRPPQVLIQVLIAEVLLNDDEDLGLEFGAQSSILFDRSLIVGDELSPGINFNSKEPLGNNSTASGNVVGFQSISNFGLGRSSADSGFGGLLVAASSGNVSVLLRALKRQKRLDVLTRPQIMVTDNKEASIQIGSNIPVVEGFTVTQFGVTNQLNRRDVGILLAVTPRITPDGIVMMQVIPEVSSLGEGVVIGTDPTGVTIESPAINITTAETTVMAADGQTIVIGGLITKEKSIDEHKIPWLGDIPVIGWAFKTRFVAAEKRELLIILTPHIIYNESDVQYVKDKEARRIDWILNDVEEVHGDIGLSPEYLLDGIVSPDESSGANYQVPVVPTNLVPAPSAIPAKLPQPAEKPESISKESANRVKDFEP